MLSFFDPEPKYQVKEVRGFVLVKYFNNGSNKWEVMVYSKETFGKAEMYTKKYLKK